MTSSSSAVLNTPANLCPDCELVRFDPAKVVPVERPEFSEFDDYGAVPLPYHLRDTYPGTPELRARIVQYDCPLCLFLQDLVRSHLRSNPQLGFFDNDGNEVKGVSAVQYELRLHEFHPLEASVQFAATRDAWFAGSIRGCITINSVEVPLEIRASPKQAKNRQHAKFKPEPYLVSERMIERICLFLDRCSGAGDSVHAHCPDTRYTTEVPTRLLHVLRDDSVQLIETKGRSVNQYAILSYCWGASENAFRSRTTLNNIDERLSGFSLASLPHTLQDSVHFTRKLGVEYIWIDSLCIIQDSGDWASESMKMMQYYENAYFTIAPVMCETADDGFLGPRPLFISTSITYPDEEIQFSFPSVENLFNEGIEESRWQTRGWTFQERLLSSRTLFIGHHDIVFACRAGRADKLARRGELPPLHWGVSYLPAAGAKDLPGSEEWRTTNSIRDRWYGLINQYAARNLTDESDKLLALYGVATKFDQLFEGRDTYLDGFWEKNIMNGLLWRLHAVESAPSKKSELFPSWSWCSMNRNLMWPGGGTESLVCAELVEVLRSADPRRPDADEAVDGLMIETFIFPAEILKIKLPSEISLEVQLDDGTDFIPDDHAELMAVVLTYYPNEEDDGDISHATNSLISNPSLMVDVSGLILKPSSSNVHQFPEHPTYLRVGVFDLMRDIDQKASSVGVLRSKEILDSSYDQLSRFYRKLWNEKDTIILV